MSFSIQAHGGECCGVKHVYQFPTATWFAGERVYGEEAKIAKLRSVIEDVVDEYDGDCDCEECTGKSPDTWSCAIEVVLVDEQVAEWGSALAAVGFKKVFSFFNSNSDNDCHVFFMATADGEIA